MTAACCDTASCESLVGWSGRDAEVSALRVLGNPTNSQLTLASKRISRSLRFLSTPLILTLRKGPGGDCDGADANRLEPSTAAAGGLVKLGLGMPNILGSRVKDAVVSADGGSDSAVG